jgi:hypothetical protein
MIKQFKVILVLLIVLTGALWASGDIVVQLRLYQGFNENGDSSGIIVSSYYLKKISEDGKILPYTEVDKEKEALKRIYKLKTVKSLARLDMVLKDGRANKLGHELVLNSRKLWLTLANTPDKKDRFKIRLDEKGKEKALMESEIIVPKGKTAVLGFEDAAEKIFFLAFNRKSKLSLAEGLKAKSVEGPKLLHIEQPAYPAEALKKGISGEVVVMGSTDREGKIGNVKALHGDPVLVRATKEALTQWLYSPWKVDDKTEPVHFIMIFVYHLKGTPKKDQDDIFKQYRPIVKANKTDKPVPWIMEMVIITGKME